MSDSLKPSSSEIQAKILTRLNKELKYHQETLMTIETTPHIHNYKEKINECILAIAEVQSQIKKLNKVD